MRKYLETTGVNTSSILSWRKRVNHTVRSFNGAQSNRLTVDCIISFQWETSQPVG